MSREDASYMRHSANLQPEVFEEMAQRSRCASQFIQIHRIHDVFSILNASKRGIYTCCSYSISQKTFVEIALPFLRWSRTPFTQYILERTRVEHQPFFNLCINNRIDDFPSKALQHTLHFPL